MTANKPTIGQEWSPCSAVPLPTYVPGARRDAIESAAASGLPTVPAPQVGGRVDVDAQRRDLHRGDATWVAIENIPGAPVAAEGPEPGEMSPAEHRRRPIPPAVAGACDPPCRPVETGELGDNPGGQGGLVDGRQEDGVQRGLLGQGRLYPHPDRR